MCRRAARPAPISGNDRIDLKGNSDGNERADQVLTFADAIRQGLGIDSRHTIHNSAMKDALRGGLPLVLPANNGGTPRSLIAPIPGNTTCAISKRKIGLQGFSTVTLGTRLTLCAFENGGGEGHRQDACLLHNCTGKSRLNSYATPSPAPWPPWVTSTESRSDDATGPAASPGMAAQRPGRSCNSPGADLAPATPL
jgi:hypothetical protein